MPFTELEQLINSDTLLEGKETINNNFNTVISHLNTVEGDAVQASTVGQPEGIAGLDSNGQVPTSQLPSLTISTVTVVQTLAERDALAAETGDLVRVTDEGATFVYDGSGWIQISSDPVLSVNGLEGEVVLTTDEINEGTNNLYFTEAKAQAAITKSFVDGLNVDADTLDGLSSADFFPAGGEILTLSTSTSVPADKILVSDGLESFAWQEIDYLAQDFNSFTTDDLTEGLNNLYYTDAKVDTKLGSIGASLIPDTDVTYDLGSDSNRWRDLYLSGTSINLGSITISTDGTTLSVVDSSTSNPITIDSGSIDDTAVSIDSSQVVSGVFDDARISSSSVTQHQANLSITESQISDLGSYVASTTVTNVESLTQSAYDTLVSQGTVDENTFYIIEG